MSRLQTYWQTMSRKKIILVVAIVIVVVGVALSWVLLARGTAGGSAAETKAKDFIGALEAGNIQVAMNHTDAPDDQQKLTLYSLMMQQMGKDYKVAKHDTRQHEGKAQESYTFQTDKDASEKFIRLVLEKHGENWQVIHVLANASEPSTSFPA